MSGGDPIREKKRDALKELREDYEELKLHQEKRDVLMALEVELK